MSVSHRGHLGVVSSVAVEFRYRPGAPAVLAGFNHEFPPGALTVVTGPSGCGKSTLLYLLGLLLRPTKGQILWDGVDVSKRPDAERSAIRAQDVGFVFQDAMLDPTRSILANVLESALYAGLEPGAARERAHELLERFGVVGRITHRPGEISGGQAQRVAVCRAILKEPRVILADEPTGNLDEASADVVWEALRANASAGATIVVATHDRRRGSNADALIEL